METKRFNDMLVRLQELQRVVTSQNKIHSLSIVTGYWRSDPELGAEPDELSITVYVIHFDDIVKVFKFREVDTHDEWEKCFEDIKAYIEEE